MNKASGSFFIALMPPKPFSNFSCALFKVRTSFLVKPEVFSSFKASSKSSIFLIDLEIVMLLVRVPPSHLFETYGIEHSVPALFISSFTEGFVPTNKIVPDCAARPFKKAHASFN